MTSWTHGNYMLTMYWQDIPESYRLLSKDEFEEDIRECGALLRKRDPRGWSIALLSDGKCDGHGYNPPYGGCQYMSREEIQSQTETTMGDVMLVRDTGADSSWVRQCISCIEGNVESCGDDFVTYSHEKFKQRGSVLVSSCPGDQHGNMHSNVKRFTEGEGWYYAPVQFAPGSEEARQWFKYWKVAVERCLSNQCGQGNRFLMEVKIDGGGAGCEQERSKNMQRWWVDCVKRMGVHLHAGMSRRGNNPFPLPSGTEGLVVAQVVTKDSDFYNFPRGQGRKLPLMENNEGYALEVHYLLLNDRKNWMVYTVMYRESGGRLVKSGSTYKSGRF